MFYTNVLKVRKEIAMSYTNDSNIITREYFDSLLVETRYLGSDLPDTKMSLFGKEFATPVMTAALSHLHKVCDNGMREFAKGAKDANAACFVGMLEDSELEDMLSTGADMIKIIKPHEDDSLIFHKLEHAVSNGCFAVGMDVDHTYNSTGGYDNVLGLPMKAKTLSQMKEYISASKVPFVVKGVLSPKDAENSVKIGAKAIIVSHHHGIMPYSVPPLMALPEILKATQGQLTVIVDCGIESGMDVFKCLALGADGVCVGRNLMDALAGKSAAMTARINEITNELKSIMARTGSSDIKHIDPTVIHHRNF